MIQKIPPSNNLEDSKTIFIYGTQNVPVAPVFSIQDFASFILPQNNENGVLAVLQRFSVKSFIDAEPRGIIPGTAMLSDFAFGGANNNVQNWVPNFISGGGLPSPIIPIICTHLCDWVGAAKLQIVRQYSCFLQFDTTGYPAGFPVYYVATLEFKLPSNPQTN